MIGMSLTGRESMDPSLNPELMESGLRLDGERFFEKLPWLEESHTNPTDFWRGLKNAVDSLYTIGGATSLFRKYDFFHDIIQRNRNNPAPALCWYDSAVGMKEISYAELGRVAEAKVVTWARLGVQPGQTLCIIRPVGVDLVSDLLAGLKTGVVLSFLPPWGRAFLQRRLDVLQPHHISADQALFPVLSSWRDAVLPEEADATEAPVAQAYFHGYPAGEALFRLFGRSSSAELTPVDISCDAAYLSALRDGVLSLGLRPGKTYAAPDFHFLETQPAMLLAGLLSGATFLHLRPKEIAAGLEHMGSRPITTFGVSSSVRDLLLTAPVDLEGRWVSWFRNPAESFDLQPWQFFVRNLNLANSFAFNLRWDAALGGCSLLSARRKGSVHMNVLPPPGCAWALGNPAEVGMKGPLDAGSLCLSLPGEPDDDLKDTACMLVPHRQEWLLTGLKGVSLHGACYPTEEILATLHARVSFSGLFFSITDVSRSEQQGGSSVVLLVFTGRRTDVHQAALESDIQAVIAQEVGDEFKPSLVTFFPLFPRFSSGQNVDHAWVRSQYLSGVLGFRAQGEVYRCITRLRRLTM